MTLRDYQDRDVSRILVAIGSGDRSVLYTLPTGGGKTIVALEIARRRRVAFVAPWRSIVDQTAAAAVRAGLAPRVIMAGRPDFGGGDVTIACAPSLLARHAPVSCDVVVIDEAHQFSPDDVRALARRVSARAVVLLSATPWRAGGPVRADRAIAGPSPAELVARGLLRRPAIRVEPAPADWPARTVAFFARVAESRRQARARPGVVHVDAESTVAERDDAIDRLAAGASLANVGVLLEGFDGRCEAVVIDRPLSLRQYVQAIGRALRPVAPGDAPVWDVRGASTVWGSPLDLPWPLWTERAARPATLVRRAVCQRCAEAVAVGGAHTCRGARPHVTPWGATWIAAVQASAGLSWEWRLEAEARAGAASASTYQAAAAELSAVARALGFSGSWVRGRLDAAASGRR